MSAYLIPNLILFIVNIVLVSVLVYYLRSLKRKSKALGRFENNASQKVEKIIEQATEKSQQILLETDYLTAGQVKMLESALSEIREDNLRALQNTVDRLASIAQKSLEREESVLTEKYLAEMEKTWSALNKKLQDKTEQLLNQFAQDTQEYKEARIGELDKEISRQVLLISAKVLNRSIPLDQHNELVVEALEQAKKEGLFNF